MMSHYIFVLFDDDDGDDDDDDDYYYKIFSFLFSIIRFENIHQEIKSDDKCIQWIPFF